MDNKPQNAVDDNEVLKDVFRQSEELLKHGFKYAASYIEEFLKIQSKDYLLEFQYIFLDVKAEELGVKTRKMDYLVLYAFHYARYCILQKAVQQKGECFDMPDWRGYSWRDIYTPVVSEDVKICFSDLAQNIYTLSVCFDGYADQYKNKDQIKKLFESVQRCNLTDGGRDLYNDETLIKLSNRDYLRNDVATLRDARHNPHRTGVELDCLDDEDVYESALKVAIASKTRNLVWTCHEVFQGVKSQLDASNMQQLIGLYEKLNPIDEHESGTCEDCGDDRKVQILQLLLSLCIMDKVAQHYATHGSLKINTEIFSICWIRGVDARYKQGYDVLEDIEPELRALFTEFTRNIAMAYRLSFDLKNQVAINQNGLNFFKYVIGHITSRYIYDFCDSMVITEAFIKDLEGLAKQAYNGDIPHMHSVLERESVGMFNWGENEDSNDVAGDNALENEKDGQDDMMVDVDGNQPEVDDDGAIEVEPMDYLSSNFGNINLGAFNFVSCNSSGIATIPHSFSSSSGLGAEVKWNTPNINASPLSLPTLNTPCTGVKDSGFGKWH